MAAGRRLFGFELLDLAEVEAVFVFELEAAEAGAGVEDGGRRTMLLCTLEWLLSGSCSEPGPEAEVKWLSILFRRRPSAPRPGHSRN